MEATRTYERRWLTLAVAGRLGGPTGRALTTAATDAFVHAMSQGLVVGAGFALVGGLVALLFLPARAHAPAPAPAVAAGPDSGAVAFEAA
jgi:hypothetical protein